MAAKKPTRISFEKQLQAATDLAWAAGIIDGEGCIRVQRTQSKRTGRVGHCLEVSVSMTHEPTVRKLASIFSSRYLPGRIYVNRPRHHCAPTTKIVWTNFDALEVLEEVDPYLVTKDEEAGIARNFPLGDHGKRVPDEVFKVREGIWAVLTMLKTRNVSKWTREQVIKGLLDVDNSSGRLSEVDQHPEITLQELYAIYRAKNTFSLKDYREEVARQCQEEAAAKASVDGAAPPA